MKHANARIRSTFGLVALAAMAACSSGTPGASVPTDGGSPDAVASATNIAAQPPEPGYVRYATEGVTVAPDSSGQWLVWVAAPLDHDVDVVDIQGSQSAGGHHAVLYSLSDVKPVGTSREWQDKDIVTAHFLGGIGGEGGSALKLPEGAVFRLRAGQALGLQVHYLNVSRAPIVGTTTLDVKFADPSPSDRIASLVTNTSLAFNVPANGKQHVDVSCKVGQDLSILMLTNHLHQWGTRAVTRLVDTAGTTTMVKEDPVWNAEWTTNPNYTRFTLDAPLVVKAGETLTTACDWTNPTAQPLTFPSEMCVFIGFYLGDKDMGCVDNGAWAPD